MTLIWQMQIFSVSNQVVSIPITVL